MPRARPWGRREPWAEVFVLAFSMSGSRGRLHFPELDLGRVFQQPFNCFLAELAASCVSNCTLDILLRIVTEGDRGTSGGVEG